MHGIAPARWAELSPRLDELLDLPEAERPPWLAALRERDATLADELQALHAQLAGLDARGFLAAPALPAPVAPADLTGQAIGPYVLERELGRGGMGQVWLARRADGHYEGAVAIKLLQGGLLGRGDGERFAREGRILARLDAPHIARLLDAGVTAEGSQPYLVLEYVDGEPIDRHVQRHQPPLAARLALMIDAAEAVAHAHARLILHRDLKPSNVLVRSDGQLKLLDFGIAKLLGEQAGGTAGDLTQRAGQAYTPRYAAPEQLLGQEVTTATDVYALGVLLYELLGGGHPTGDKHTAHGSYAGVAKLGASSRAAVGSKDAAGGDALPSTPLAWMRAVAETEPRRLSDQVRRRGGPRAARLAAELRGDVDNIVARALKKQPAERYANAAELAEDLRRTLAHQPIRARPDAWLYRSAKFVRRHRVGVAAASVALTAVLAGAGVALQESRAARAQRVQAEGLLEFMLGDLRRKLQPVGRLDVLDAVGERALAYYAAQDAATLDADALARRARALHLIGEIAEQRGQPAEARLRFAEAARSTAELMARAPADPQRVFEHAQSEFFVAQAAWRNGQLEQAQAGLQRYLELAQRLLQLGPDKAEWQLEQAYAEQSLGVLAYEQGRPSDALNSWQRAGAVFNTQVATSEPARAGLSNNLGWVARAHEDLGDLRRSLAAHEAKIELLRRDPGQGREGQFQMAVAHNETARLRLALGNFIGSRDDAAAAAASMEALVALDGTNQEWRTALVVARVGTAEALLALGQRELASEELHHATAALGAVQDPQGLSLQELALRALWLVARARHAGAAAAPVRDMAALVDAALMRESQLPSMRGTRRRALATLALWLGDAMVVQGDLAAARSRWTQGLRLLGDAAEGELQSTAVRAHVHLRLGEAQVASRLADGLQTGPLRHPLVRDLFARLGRPL